MHRVMLNEAGDVENAFLGCLAEPLEQGVLELVPRYAGDNPLHNLVSPPPKASDRITARFTEFLIAGLNAGGAAAGWYNQGDGSARYWDGRMWTHHVTSLQVARELVQRLSDENYRGRRQEIGQADHGTVEGSSATHISTPTPGPVQLPQQPALPPAGWYPTATPGVLGYWDGQAWTGESRPDPNSFPG
jgi:hypothetical protein